MEVSAIALIKKKNFVSTCVFVKFSVWTRCRIDTTGFFFLGVAAAEEFSFSFFYFSEPGMSQT